MTKAHQLQNVVAFPAPSKAGSLDVQNKNNPMWKKAYAAFHAAKGRCNNPNNKDFHRYGGKGVKFLIGSFDELISSIGLPKKGMSLDRINPAGHYEIANLRWTNSHVQAANKVGSVGGTFLSLTALAESYKIKAVLSFDRAQLSEAWERFIAAFNRGSLTPKDVEFLRKSNLPAATFEHGWELGQEPDLADPPSYFRLPSLTQPGKVVELRGGPFYAAPQGHNEHGTLRGLRYVPLAENLHAQVRDWLSTDANGPSVGAVWVCPPTPGWLSVGGIEGQMLVACSWLRKQGQAAAFYSFWRARSELLELG